jgi:hypothetical protein
MFAPVCIPTQGHGNEKHQIAQTMKQCPRVDIDIWYNMETEKQRKTGEIVYIN